VKGDDETSSAATFSEGARSPRDMIAEHLSTPSPDTSDYNSENDDVEGSGRIVAIVVDITTMNE